MPGAYAHITLVNLAKEPRRLEKAGVPLDAIRAILGYFRFCELGAVSPDYPYLDIKHREAAPWADLMHYEKTGDMLKFGVKVVQEQNGAAKEKAFSWLLGYAAHVISDVTIHPVVELKVGPYQANKTEHRVCELHQDAHVFQRLNLGEVGLSEHLDSGIWGCCDIPNSGKLDRVVADTWNNMLKACYPGPYKSHAPNVDDWHSAFKFVVDKVEEGGRLFPFARHVAVNSGLTYPAIADINPKYIQNLKTPIGVMSYDQIFERALSNVLSVWNILARAVYMDDSQYLTAIDNWNLDTGRNEDNKYVFWEPTNA